MRTTIYLVRHAEVANPEHIYYVWLPGFDLSKMGLFQAQKLKVYFADKEISKIISSPLLRAKKTAEIIADGKIPLIFSRKIIELNCSHWQGLRADERNPSEVAEYEEDPMGADFLGESVVHVQKRMVAAILDVAKKNQGRNILLVSHADPIISALLYFQKKSLNLLNKTKLKNASITSITFNKDLKCEGVKYKEIVPAKEDGV